MSFDPRILTDPWALAAIASAVLFWFSLAWAIGGIVTQKRPSYASDRIDEERLARLREGYPVYRWFEPLIREFAGMNRALAGPEETERMQTQLSVARARLPWTPEEYLATKQVESLLMAVILFAIGSLFINVFIAAIAGAMFGMVNLMVAIMSLPSAASAKQAAFRRRLPFAVDILALLGESGVGLPDGLKIIGRENRGHPLGDEFGRVTQQLAVGKLLPEALGTLRDRIPDENVREFVLAINRGLELGTPMSEILKTQAEQMRLKRSQWGEKAAKEAEVNMTFPNLLIMLACVIVILGPILLPVYYGTGIGLTD